MNNSTNKAAPKWGNWLYIIIPAILIIGMAVAVGGRASEEKPQYYEVVQLFRSDKVSEFTLDLSSGKLEYKLQGEEKEKNYNVPNVDIFLNDIHDYVTEHNIENPEATIKYDYKKGSSGWWASMMPMLLVSLLLGGFMFYIYRKMGQNIANENNRTLSFGKARVKLGKDSKKKKTFKDVAGADEEKAGLKKLLSFSNLPKPSVRSVQESPRVCFL